MAGGAEHATRTGRGSRSGRRRSRSPPAGRAPRGRAGPAPAPRGRAARGRPSRSAPPRTTARRRPGRRCRPGRSRRRPAGRAARRRHRPGSRPSRRAGPARGRRGRAPRRRRRPGARRTATPSVVPPGDRGAGGVRQRDGQHEAAVVVGVLADDVDPAGRGPDALGRGAEPVRRRPAVRARPRPRRRSRDDHGPQLLGDVLGVGVGDERAHPRLGPGEVLQLARRAAEREQLQVQPPVLAPGSAPAPGSRTRCRASACPSGGRTGPGRRGRPRRRRPARRR